MYITIPPFAVENVQTNRGTPAACAACRHRRKRCASFLTDGTRFIYSYFIYLFYLFIYLFLILLVRASTHKYIVKLPY